MRFNHTIITDLHHDQYLLLEVVNKLIFSRPTLIKWVSSINDWKTANTWCGLTQKRLVMPHACLPAHATGDRPLYWGYFMPWTSGRFNLISRHFNVYTWFSSCCHPRHACSTCREPLVALSQLTALTNAPSQKTSCNVCRTRPVCPWLMLRPRFLHPKYTVMHTAVKPRN